MKVLFLTLLSVAVLAVVPAGALAQTIYIPVRAGSGEPVVIPRQATEITIVDIEGRRHTISKWAILPWTGSAIYGTPFAADGEQPGRDLAYSLLQVAELGPGESAKLQQTAIERGMRDTEEASIVRILPVTSVKRLTLTGDGSTVELAGGFTLRLGRPLGKIEGEEDLGALGTSEFSIEIARAREIFFDGTAPFNSDFDMLYVTEVPFRTRITDLGGRTIAFQKALVCSHRQSFSSKLRFMRGETNEVTVPVSKIRSIALHKLEATSDGGWDTSTTLKTGETFELRLNPPDGVFVPNGILGVTEAGWVWASFNAISAINCE